MRIDKNMQNASLIVWDVCLMAHHPIIEVMINQLEMGQNIVKDPQRVLDVRFCHKKLEIYLFIFI
jgi:hypothetical protein